MGGVSEKHLMRMNVDPFSSKAPREIPAQPGGHPLSHDEPNRCTNAECRRGRSGIGPRRDSRQPEARSEDQENERDRRSALRGLELLAKAASEFIASGGLSRILKGAKA